MKERVGGVFEGDSVSLREVVVEGRDVAADDECQAVECEAGVCRTEGGCECERCLHERD